MRAFILENSLRFSTLRRAEKKIFPLDLLMESLKRLPSLAARRGWNIKIIREHFSCLTYISQAKSFKRFFRSQVTHLGAAVVITVAKAKLESKCLL